MGAMDCCHRGVSKELVIETDQDHIPDTDGFPQDTDPAFRSKKVEIENQNENINENVIEEAVNPENNNNPLEVEEMNIPTTDSNDIQEANVENNEYNQETNINEIVNNAEENNEQINNVENGINIDQILNNYNEQQIQQSQNVEEEEDYNKYFDQAPTPMNDNNDIDINQYFNDNANTQVNLNSHFTFGDTQNNNIDNLILSNNAQGSQEYNYDIVYENQNA